MLLQMKQTVSSTFNCFKSWVYNSPQNWSSPFSLFHNSWFQDSVINCNLLFWCLYLYLYFIYHTEDRMPPPTTTLPSTLTRRQTAQKRRHTKKPGKGNDKNGSKMKQMWMFSEGQSTSEFITHHKTGLHPFPCFTIHDFMTSCGKMYFAVLFIFPPSHTEEKRKPPTTRQMPTTPTTTRQMPTTPTTTPATKKQSKMKQK